MKKLLKYLALAVGGVVALVLAAAAYVAATFNPNDYKPQLVQLVKQKYDRTLKITGDVKLAFYPSIGVDLGGLSLSEHGSEKEFAAIGGARVSLKFMPLLSRQAVVSRVELHGLRAQLVKHKDGTTNIDDLKGGASSPAAPSGGSAPAPADAGTNSPAQFSVAGVLIDDASLAYVDEGSGAKYTVDKLNLKTGRIALGTPADVELSAAVGASAPPARLDLKLKARLSFAADSGRFKVEGLDFSARGDAAGMKLAALNLKASAEGDAKAVKTDELVLELDARQADKAIAARLGGVLAANLETQVFDLSKLSANVTLNDPKSAPELIKLSLTGSANANVPRQSAVLNFSTRFDDSTITGKAGVSRFSPPAFVFDLNVDQLDLDRYSGGKKAEGAGGSTTAKPETPLDFSALKGLQASGSVKIGALKVANLKAQNVRMDLRASGGRVDVNPLNASLYQGTLSGSLSLVAAATPQMSAKQTLSGISVGPLLKDAINKDIVEGKGNVALDVTAQGNTVSALKKALGGSASINLADGAIKGINLAEAIRKAQSALGSAKGGAAMSGGAGERTDFTELKASFAIRNGVAHNSDLSLKSPLLRLGGEGDINIGTDSLDYLAKATLVASASGQGGKEATDLKGLTIPVRISGPFASPGFKLDANALLKGAAQQRIDVKKDEVKSKLQDKLKGLFKR